MTEPTDPNATARYDASAAVPPADAPSAPQPSGWSTPPGPPPTRRPPAADHGHLGSMVAGLVLVGIGLWFFADVSLGLELPRISWSQLWPVFIIAVGAWIALGSMRRGSR